MPENEKAEKGSLICFVRPLRFCYLKLSMRLCIHFIVCLVLFYLALVRIEIHIVLAHAHTLSRMQCIKCLKMWQPHMI